MLRGMKRLGAGKNRRPHQTIIGLTMAHTVLISHMYKTIGGPNAISEMVHGLNKRSLAIKNWI
jgi:hypothetical protein